jgi:hypothetical protein
VCVYMRIENRQTAQVCVYIRVWRESLLPYGVCVCMHSRVSPLSTHLCVSVQRYHTSLHKSFMRRYRVSGTDDIVEAPGECWPS